MAGSATFTDSLETDAGSGVAVSFTTTTSSPAITVSPSGEVTTTGALSAAGSPYTVSGTDTDANNDSGSWTFTLTVTPDVIVQGPPTAGFITSDDSAEFTSVLVPAAGFVGPVTFTTTTPGFSIVGNDDLQPTQSLSAADSPYSISGVDSDSYGDSGSWTYVLTVAPSGSLSNLVQTSSTTGTVSTTSSAKFTTGPITVQNNIGSVIFVTTKPNSNLSVTEGGQISTTGSLTAGAYEVSGTDTDSHGDSGTWTYVLTVTPVVATVTFNANGGTGKMGPQSESAPTALSLNGFVWTRHSFVDWNTSSNGAGTSYANGAVYPFGASTTLFAQWRLGKVPSHAVTFEANGGTGFMTPEVDNSATALSPNHFVRTGYVFVKWSTSVDGSGIEFAPGATYPFTRSVTLFAQWKVVPKPADLVVRFSANGGTGLMVPEHHRGPKALTPNQFVRANYNFAGWNTLANGAGTRYANRAVFPFVMSTTLYAQWKLNETITPPPAIPGGIPIGTFAKMSSTLSLAMRAQIQNLAQTVKSKGKNGSMIQLLGFGDTLTATQNQNRAMVSLNVGLGRKRAQAVASYLEGELSSLGVQGWTISIEAASAGTPSQSVVATLS